MPDTTKAGDTPDLAAQFAELKSAVTGLISDITTPLKALIEGQKTHGDAIAKLLSPPAATDAAAKETAGKAAPLTAESIASLVTKTVTDALTAKNATDAVRAARDGFVATKMNDLPSAYSAQLPNTDDPAKLAAAEQTIRTQFKADQAKLGVTAQTIGGAAKDGTKVAAVIDDSKFSLEQVLERDLKPVGSLPRVTAAASGAATGA